jgi:hypothetical protein
MVVVETQDFIEIFNPTASPVNVSGWSVQYAAAAGTSWTVTNLSGTINPGKYYLIQEGSGGANGIALPTPDATGTIDMALGAGKVALVNSTVALSGACPTTGIIDFIGYGTTATCFEGVIGKAPAPSNTTSDLRQSNGCTDTDNNASDFATGAPNPRNSATAANLCSGTVVVCSGTIPAAISATGGSGGTGVFSYQWYKKAGVICPTGTDISGWTPLGAGDGTGFNTTTFTPTAPVTDDVTFALLVTQGPLVSPAVAPCGPPTWAAGCRVIVVNNVTGGTVGTNQTVCSGGDPAAFTQSVASTGDGTLTYQWQVSNTDCTTGFANIEGATNTTYDAPAGITSFTYYRRVTTSTLNGVVCTANSNCIIVIPNDVTGGTVGSSTGSGNLTYQWQSTTEGCDGVFSNIGGATNSTYDPPSGLTQTTYYRRLTISTLNAVPCSTISNCVTVLINNVTGGTVGSDQTICQGGDPALFTESVASTGTGALTYQWQSSTTGCGGTFSNIVGATSATYDAPAGVNVTTNYRRVTKSTFNGVECTANSNCITVTARITTGGTVAASQTICSGGDPAAFTESVASTGDGVLSYQWQSSTTDCSTGFTNIEEATLTTYDPPAGLTVTTGSQLPLSMD